MERVSGAQSKQIKHHHLLSQEKRKKYAQKKKKKPTDLGYVGLPPSHLGSGALTALSWKIMKTVAPCPAGSSKHRSALLQLSRFLFTRPSPAFDI